jgi:hypothetical protein
MALKPLSLTHSRAGLGVDGVVRCRLSSPTQFFHELEAGAEELLTWRGEVSGSAAERHRLLKALPTAVPLSILLLQLYLEFHRGTYT